LFDYPDVCGYIRKNRKQALPEAQIPAPGDQDRKELERFLWAYAEAPLFLVGFSDEGLVIEDVDSEWIGLFKLPYQSMVLEFPKATYRFEPKRYNTSFRSDYAIECFP
jgi:hypothetical protein